MRWFFTILILAAGLLAALLTVGHAVTIEQSNELMRSGAKATGIVTEQLGTKGSNAKHYSYRFRAGDREVTATRRDIPWEAREIPVGSPIEVRYDPAKPERSITAPELEEAGKWGNRLFFPLLAAGLFGWAIARVVRKPKPPT